jgi:uncharacterized delta-60 repeat protein
MRYNTNGTRDNTFGTNGVKVLDYTSLISGGTGDADYVSRIVQQPDGKILLGGKYRNTNQQLDDWAFCRLNPDGTPDASFGINGALIAGMQYKEMVTGMGLQDDGSIIAGGGCGNGYTDFRIFKVNSNGTMNTTFGTAVTGMGWGYTALVAETFTNHTVTDLAVLPDDKIIVAGGVGFSHGLVVRYLPDGTYDPTFAGDGQYDTIPSGPVNLSITAMAVDTLRGRIYVGGYYSDPDLGTGVAWIKGLHNGPGQPFGLPQEHSVKFTLWPNPANDIVTISGENIQELELTDLSGRIIYRSSTPGTQQIALEQFPSGIYCVRVYTDSGIAVQKLVKK